jgi:hypothetical protein
VRPEHRKESLMGADSAEHWVNRCLVVQPVLCSALSVTSRTPDSFAQWAQQ